MSNIDSVVEPNWKELSVSISASMFQILIGYVCADIMAMVNLHFMGQYTGAYQTAIFGVAWLIIQLIAFPMGYGLTQTLNNQASQAMGQSKLKLSQLYLNFTIWTIMILLLPIFSVILFHAQSLLAFLIQEPNEISREYAREIMIPLMCASIFLMQAECLKNYLIACQIFRPFPYIHGVTLMFHILMCSLLFKFGSPSYFSLSIAIVLSEILILLILLGYIYINEKAYALFKGFSLGCQIFKYKSTYILYIKESLPLVLHTYADFIVFYVLSIIAFSLGTNETSAQLAFSNTSSFFFKFPISLSMALMSFVGSSLSQNRISLAKLYIRCGMGVYGIILLIQMTLLIAMRQIWANIYTSVPIIQDLMLSTLPYFLLGSIFFDGIQATLSGVLKGVNKQSIPSNQTLFSYYIIGVPLILILTFYYNLRLIGIWLGFAVANIYLTIIFTVFIINLDWEQQVAEISAKLKKHESCVDEQELEMLYQE